MKKDYDFYNEVEALMDLKDTNVVPKLHAAWTCNGDGFIIMEKLDSLLEKPGGGNYKGCTDNASTNFEAIKNILEICKKAGWLHIDVHIGNVMCKKGKPILIDWGWGVKKGKKGEIYDKCPICKQYTSVQWTWEKLVVQQDIIFNNYFNLGKTSAEREFNRKTNKMAKKLGI